MLVVGSEFIDMKPLNGFNYVGNRFNVTQITDGMIGFKAGKGCNFDGVGTMSFDEFHTYFKEIIPKTEKPEIKKVHKKNSNWTHWKFVYCDGAMIAYKYNGKRVIVKRDKCTASASCHPTDKFDLEYGLGLAIARLIPRLIKRDIEDLQTKYDMYLHQAELYEHVKDIF
jgi:hypothetical protein